MPRVTDGYPTLITLGTTGEFGSGAGIRLFEKEVTPPELMAGGPIDITDMRTITYRQKARKKLIDVGPIVTTVAYATEAIEKIQAALGLNQQITTTFADGGTLVCWGYLDSFKPGPIREGTEPTAEATFIITNRDNDGVVQGPEYTSSGDTTGTA